MIFRRFRGLRDLLARTTQRLRNEGSPELPDAVGAVDVMADLDGSSFYIDGWITDAEGASLSIVAGPEWDGVNLTARMFRYARPDLADILAREGYDLDRSFAFACFFALDTPANAPTRWWLKVQNSDGTVKKLEIPPVIRDPDAIRDSIVARLKYETPSTNGLMKDHVAPALSRLQRRLQREAKVNSVIEYGTGPSSPAVSIVVPIHRRIDFVENQLSQFARDPEMQEADVIYVLDSPELGEHLLASAPHLFDLYHIHFRIALLERHVGYAGATNVGASLSRARLLLLLHSDVLPGTPGWLGGMRSSYEVKASAGALGPKLLFEDGTIQHAGISFVRSPDSFLWDRSLRYKGLHGGIPPAAVPRLVPAVTGACLMIDNGLFHDFGGLEGEYLEPDYEALNLQLKLRKAGFENWYAGDVCLYHLEERPTAPELGRLYGKYDSWLLTDRWGEHEELLSEPTDRRDA